MIEDEILPLYFDRSAEGVPEGWVRAMKNSIATLAWRFSAARMVRDYLAQCYLPAAGASQRSGG